MKRPFLKIALKILLVAVVALYLGLAVIRNATKLREVEFAFHVWPFLLSSLLVLAQFFQQSTCWWLLVRGVAGPVPASESQAIWFASQVSKYVPGRVMLPLVRYTLLKRRGVPLGRTMISIYLELTLMTGAAVLVALLASIGFAAEVWGMLAAKIHWFGDGATLRWAVLALVPMTLVGIHPRLLQSIINRGLRIIKRNPVEFAITYRRMLALGAAYVAGWAIYALAGWLLLVSLGVDDPALGFRIAAAFLVAWVIAFLSFVTPGGLGIREAVLTALLTLWGVPLAVAGVAAILCRLQWTGDEALGALLTLRYRPRVSRAELAAEAAVFTAEKTK